MASDYLIRTEQRLEPHLQQEWLLTNGLGGYASSTVLGCNTRRYHGLLCAAITPPVGRLMLLNRIGEIVTFDEQPEHLLEFSINQFGDRFHPRGDRYLREFALDHDADVARWEYDVDGIAITKLVQMRWRQNMVAIRYAVRPPVGRAVTLSLLPFVSLRDFHALRHTDTHYHIEQPTSDHLRVSAGSISLHLHASAGRFVESPTWWYDHTYAIEQERGLDFSEDLFTPGKLVWQTSAAAELTLCASATAIDPGGCDWDGWLRERHTARSGGAAGSPRSAIQKKLLRAADDFIVARRYPDGSAGTSIVAGYPWFADWGRDTMISLPGLLLATQRFEQARQVLTVFGSYVSQGMIPNRFDDYTNQPHYNTVDASLWFIHACFLYRDHSKDHQTFERVLKPACQAIIDGYRAGTRYRIRMDQSDGLITQGDASTQLTWMDAKCDGIAFTPRQGKAVEINALWYHALVLMGEHELAGQVRESFQRVFWISPFRGLADVVDDDGRRDDSIRPNQIFAASLANSALSRDQQHAVVEIVRRELLTPVGLRTLAPSDPKFQARFSGAPRQRDAAYHNGTIWPWLMGAFIEAHLRVHDRSPQSLEQARQWLSPLLKHLGESGCIGQISEVFEAAEPHRPAACCAQAWSVAEVLRAGLEAGL